MKTSLPASGNPGSGRYRYAGTDSRLKGKANTTCNDNNHDHPKNQI